LAVDHPTFSVRTAGGWCARLADDWLARRSRNDRNSALAGRFADVALHAVTDRVVVDDLTDSVGSTNTRTRITALLIDAGQIGRAVGVEDAFRTGSDDVGSCGRTRRTFGWNWFHDDWYRSTTLVSVASESFDASADRIVFHNAADGVLAASSRTRIATFLVDASQSGRTFRVGGTFRTASFGTLSISVESWTTDADRVLDGTDTALGVGAAR
jgi:hypothetical protein